MLDKYVESSANHCYPGTTTLVNKLDITDYQELYEAERELVTFRLAELNEKPIKGSFDLNHLKKIHAYLFQDVYEWAGKVRNYNISKSGVTFCLSDFILNYSNQIFGRIHDEHFFIDDDYDTKLMKLVQVFSDINALHPFREGNGRTQRLFVEWLARIVGIRLDLTNVAKVEMIVASYDGFKGEYEHLFSIFKQNSHALSLVVQLKNIQHLLADKDKKLILSILENKHQKVLK